MEKVVEASKVQGNFIESFFIFGNKKSGKDFAFCIMDNHIHLIWQSFSDYTSRDNQHSFTKFTAQQIKFDFLNHHPKELEYFRVNAKDRMYQFWQRNPLPILLYNESVFIQKLHYIHENPVKAGLCKNAEDYEYSSASYYFNGKSRFEFFTHF